MRRDVIVENEENKSQSDEIRGAYLPNTLIDDLRFVDAR
jgi:hypothetical protein